MKKNIKYLLSLLLVFGLAVSDYTLNSPSKSATYYQFSNAIVRSELNHKPSKVYLYKQITAVEKIAFVIPLNYLQPQESYSLQIPKLLKKQTQLYQKSNSFARQHIFLKEIITSKNTISTLYIA